MSAAKAAEARDLVGRTVRLIGNPASGYNGRTGPLEVIDTGAGDLNRLGVRTSPGCLVALSWPYLDHIELTA